MNIETIEVIEPSIEPKSSLYLQLIGSASLEGVNIQIQISRIFEDHTLWWMTTHANLVETEKLEIPLTSDLPIGIYSISNISFFHKTENEEEPPVLLHRYVISDYRQLLFEIRNKGQGATNKAKLVEIVDKVLENRQRKFLKGIGSGANKYHCIVFARNLLISKRMRIEQCEILPFEGLACADELNLIDRFLKADAGSGIQNYEEVLTRSAQQQPTVVLRFPLVYADGVEHAGQTSETEAELVLNLFGLHRGSPPEIFGSYVTDMANRESFYRIHTPKYRGNILKGSIAGENPDIVQKQLLKIRAHPNLDLFISLYNEARQEEDIEFAYFRYWNILEVIARSKNLIGLPRKTERGLVMKNQKGYPITIADRAEELVFELIRQISADKNASLAASKSKLEQCTVQERIAIWYRHRNCVVHCGGCFPDNVELCNREKEKYRNCREAHLEITKKFGGRNRDVDGYFRSLTFFAELVVNHELN